MEKASCDVHLEVTFGLVHQVFIWVPWMIYRERLGS